MNDYMITVSLPEEFDDEFISRIPAQRALINELMARGVITSYSLSSDRQTLWITMVGQSEDAVQKALEKMPLYEYMECDIRDLMFHNNPVFAPPKFTLN